MKSWKTGLSGLLALLPQALTYFFPKVVTQEVANAISLIMVSLGLVAAKDSNVTGGTKQQ